MLFVSRELNVFFLMEKNWWFYKSESKKAKKSRNKFATTVVRNIYRNDLYMCVCVFFQLLMFFFVLFSVSFACYDDFSIYAGGDSRYYSFF